MDSVRTQSVRIDEKTHHDLKIMAALTKRSMGELTREMVHLYKQELSGGKEWGDDARSIIAETEREVGKTKRAIERRKKKVAYKKEVMAIIGKLRDEEKLTYDEIAARLTVDEYQTPTGKDEWQTSTVHKYYKEHKDSKLPSVLEHIKQGAK